MLKNKSSSKFNNKCFYKNVGLANEFNNLFNKFQLIYFLYHGCISIQKFD